MCKVSTQTEDSNIDPKRISSLEVHMAALKSSLKAHGHISKKRCLEKYCSCDKACQFPAF